MRRSCLSDVAHSFIDRGHTGQIIGAENSCAVARYGSVIMENSLFPFCGLHRVHVGGKENRRTVNTARDTCKQIARIRTGLLLCMIFCKIHSDFGEFCFQSVRHLALL